MIEKMKAMGALRNSLHGLAVIFILILPFAEPKWHPENGWELLMGAMIPATAPIIFVVLMFDVLMTTVMKSGADAARLAVSGTIIRFNITLGVVMMSIWLWSFNKSLFL